MLVARQGEQVEVEGHVGDHVAGDVGRAGGLDRPGRQRVELASMIALAPTLAILATVGTSIRMRSSVISSMSRSEGSTTRKPLLRATSIKPSLARCSIASRTGVGDTPNSRASTGAE